MAVTPNQLETVLTSTPFRQRIEFALVAIAENIATESAGTARHADRARLASQILNNPDNFVTQFAQGVVAQLPLASTNMVTVSGVANADIDTTDATFQTTISSIFNDFLPQP